LKQVHAKWTMQLTLLDNTPLGMSTQTRRDLNWMELMMFWSMLIMLIYGRKTFQLWKKIPKLYTSHPVVLW